MYKIFLSITGILGAIYFMGFMTILSLRAEDYSILRDMMSKLGSHGSPYFAEVNIMGFMAIGVVIVIFGANLYSSLRRSVYADVVGILLTVSGFFMVILGFFPCDAECHNVTLLGKMHNYLSIPVVIMIPMSALVSALAFYRDKKWKSKFWWMSSISLGTLALLLSEMMLVFDLNSYLGLFQRLATGIMLAWMMLVSAKILSMEKNNR